MARGVGLSLIIAGVATSAPGLAEWLASHASLMIVGGLGGWVRSLAFGERLWPETPINILAGAAWAVFLAPVAVPLARQLLEPLQVAELSATHAAAYVLGVLGVTITRAAVSIATALRREGERRIDGDDP